MIVSWLISLKCAHISKLVRDLWPHPQFAHLRLVEIRESTFWKRFNLNWGLSSEVVIAFILTNSTAFSWALVSLGLAIPLFFFAYINESDYLRIGCSYKFEVERVFLFNFLMCSYTIVVANNSINRSRRAVGLAKSNILWHTLLSSAADVSNKGIDAGVVGLSEIFLLLGIDDTLLDTHLIELLEITLSLLGLALWVKFPWGGHNTSIFLITTISFTKGKTFRREITGGWLSLTHVILDQEQVLFVD